MPDFTLRKMLTIIEEIRHEGGPPPARPRRRAAVLAVVSNPFAGGYAEELEPAMEDLKPLGLEMTDRLIAAMGGSRGSTAMARPGWPARAANWSTPRSGMCPAGMPCANGWERRARSCLRR